MANERFRQMEQSIVLDILKKDIEQLRAGKLSSNMRYIFGSATETVLNNLYRFATMNLVSVALIKFGITDESSERLTPLAYDAMQQLDNTAFTPAREPALTTDNFTRLAEKIILRAKQSRISAAPRIIVLLFSGIDTLRPDENNIMQNQLVVPFLDLKDKWRYTYVVEGAWHDVEGWPNNYNNFFGWNVSRHKDGTIGMT